MSPQLKEFLKALMIDLSENHLWTTGMEGGGDIEDCIVFDVAEKHAHLVESADWKEKRLAELHYQIQQANKEIEGLLL